MRTTHVIRGDEWISSVPKHLELFQVCWASSRPKYAPCQPHHEGGERRPAQKLSKRKDPEAAMRFYTEQGYPGGQRGGIPDDYRQQRFSRNWRRRNP